MGSEIPYRIADAVDILGRTPEVLRTLLSGLPQEWIENNYGPETFSPFDVVGHLIHGEETDWMVRLRIILRTGRQRSFEPFDRYAMYEHSQGKSLARLLDEFEQLRRRNLRELVELKLGSEQLDLEGEHPALGAVTARQLLATWVVHDLNHIHQIAKCMAYQYRREIGPWRPYVGVLPPEAQE